MAGKARVRVGLPTVVCGEDINQHKADHDGTHREGAWPIAATHSEKAWGYHEASHSDAERKAHAGVRLIATMRSKKAQANAGKGRHGMTRGKEGTVRHEERKARAGRRRGERKVRGNT
ncbi:hypothetical protein GUJ93_ZPchr0002g23978 [Zizania palustris]|uniref:Uncharacterized protein n=1 Tax=Zizania palustris TaxID=103762 RepID=A0A8J5RTA9_ZIZPA|nr:hypothetical protein GUJ93_ZPchr0002g23978 [Zizania palustris]